jgi:hypothetical protein
VLADNHVSGARLSQYGAGAALVSITSGPVKCLTLKAGCLECFQDRLSTINRHELVAVGGDVDVFYTRTVRHRGQPLSGDHLDRVDAISALVFYTTAGCHLCEMAENILYAAGIRFTAVDVDTDLALIEKYGLRIPVVRDRRGRELGWPFDGGQLRLWLEED